MFLFIVLGLSYLGVFIVILVLSYLGFFIVIMFLFFMDLFIVFIFFIDVVLCGDGFNFFNFLLFFYLWNLI